MKIWLKFSKEEACRFLSHRDVLRLMTRALRRAGVPVAFSQGFNPHPKVSFAAPLPVGSTSQAEYMELILAEPQTPNAVKAALNETMQPGITILQAAVASSSLPTLMSWVERSIYVMSGRSREGDFNTHVTQEKINYFLQRHEIMYEKKTKRKVKYLNVRPWIYEIEILEIVADKIRLQACIQTGQQGNFKVEEFWQVLDQVSVLDLQPNPETIHRIELLGPSGRAYVTPFQMLGN